MFTLWKVKKREAEGDVDGLAALLRKKSWLGGEYAQRARAALGNDDTRLALLYCLVLAMCRHAEAVPLYGQMRLPKGFLSNLREAWIVSLASCLLVRKSPLLDRLFREVAERQAAIQQRLEAEHPAEWFEYHWGPKVGRSGATANVVREVEICRNSDVRNRLLTLGATAVDRGEAADAMHYLSLLANADTSSVEPLLVRMFDPTRAGLIQKLDSATAQQLAAIVLRVAPTLLQPLLQSLTGAAFLEFGRGLQGEPLTLWLRLALERDDCFLTAVDRLAELKANLLPATARQPRSVELAGEQFKTSQERVRALLAAASVTAKIESLVRQILVLSIQLRESIQEPTRVLIARAVGNFSMSGLPHAGALLAESPRVEWGEGLRRAWLRIDDLDRRRWRAESDPTPKTVPPEAKKLPDTGLEVLAAMVEPSATAIADAWAACAARDSGYTNLDADNILLGTVRDREQQFEDVLARRKELLGQLIPLLKQYEAEQAARHAFPHYFPGPSRFRVSPEMTPLERSLRDGQAQLRRLDAELDTLNREVDAGHQEVRRSLSPASLFRLAVADGLRYSVGVRQAAAGGICRLLREGHLGPQCRDELRDTLQAACASEEFRERRVFVPADAAVEEIGRAIQNGLDWMIALAPYRRAVPRWPEWPGMPGLPDLVPGWLPHSVSAESVETHEDYPDLPVIAELIAAHLPAASAFFHHYPLRLMTLDDHRGVLGQYRAEGCGIQWWTRYQPPLGRGPVRERYLQLDDRTRPNAMGIHYRLFRHPVLAVSVMYHEYLHYGGLTGRPADGIQNEMAVKLRELVFARGLIARLAPRDDTELPAFEKRLADSVLGVGCPELIGEWLDELTDDRLDRHNNFILEIYGPQLDPEDAAGKAQWAIDECNDHIRVRNLGQTWDPHVEWPLLDKNETRYLTEQFRLIRTRWLCQRNVITSGERDEILRESACRRDSQAWEAYRRRPHALETLSAINLLAGSQ